MAFIWFNTAPLSPVLYLPAQYLPVIQLHHCHQCHGPHLWSITILMVTFFLSSPTLPLPALLPYPLSPSSHLSTLFPPSCHPSNSTLSHNLHIHILAISSSCLITLAYSYIKPYTSVQWLTKLSQCFGLLNDLSINFEIITNTNRFLEHQKNYLIRAIQCIKNYIIVISSHRDMIDSTKGLIDSVLWGGIRNIRIWCSTNCIVINPW